jgi:Fic family protein
VLVSDWPGHGRETRPWRQQQRRGTREDRELREVTVSLPPSIADRTVPISTTQASDIESAVTQIAALDQAHGEQLAALGMLLLRTESVASSKIEGVDATLVDYARASYGIRSNESATSMVAATAALETLMRTTTRKGRVDGGDLLAAHKTLMADDANERGYAGRWRESQNWIGGSEYSPRNALYVPPPEETVPTYIADLVRFTNRDDLPVMVQAAVAHAQFESIHPFTDGNGRVGRALINAVFRRRRLTTTVVVPLASALVAHRDRYFGVLDSYRAGDVEPLISSFAAASRISAAESRVTADRLAHIPNEWSDLVGRVRAGSAAEKLLALLPGRPVLSVDDACTAVAAPTSSVYAAIDRLHTAGVLRSIRRVS